MRCLYSPVKDRRLASATISGFGRGAAGGPGATVLPAAELRSSSLRSSSLRPAAGKTVGEAEEIPLFFTLIPVLALLSNYDRENCLINVGTEGVPVLLHCDVCGESETPWPGRYRRSSNGPFARESSSRCHRCRLPARWPHRHVAPGRHSPPLLPTSSTRPGSVRSASLRFRRTRAEWLATCAPAPPCRNAPYAPLP